MTIKNQTEIQLMKILFKTSGKRPTKKITSPRAYPHGIERKYYRELESFFKPLTDYVENFINQNMEPLLRGDSEELHLDTIPGDTFRKMIYNLENWLSIYMPDISELPADKNNNVILTTIAKTADEAMDFGNKEFTKMLDKGIHVNLPTSAPWWDDMKASWAEDNYNLITSNAKNYVSKINTLTEQAIVNGMSPGKLKEEIFKATQGLEKSHCKLLARDQMGKLNGQITQAQMQEIGLDMYVWSTAYDDRVRDSHAAMEGLLCRWDDASVVSYDGGKTWVDRPAAAVQLHPGQDIQCRCVGLAYYPELTAEIEGVPLEDVIQDMPPVQDLPEFKEVDYLQSFIKDGVATKGEDFENYISKVFSETDIDYQKAMTKIAKENKKSIIYNPKTKISHFSPTMENIEIKSFESTGTFRHEMGHYLDYLLGSTREIKDRVFGGKVEKAFYFSMNENFVNAYEKEVKKMIDTLSAEATKNVTRKLSKTEMKWYLGPYVYEKYKQDETFGAVFDMLTAFTRTAYSGHSVKYFYDTNYNRRYPELRYAKRNTEGFAELCDIFFNKNLKQETRDFFNLHFPETRDIIFEAVNIYIRS